MKFIRLLLLSASLLLVSSATLAQPINNSESLSISLSNATQEAINHGIPLTFICELAEPKKWLFFSWHKRQKEHRFVVTHHVLSNRYLVHRDGQQTPTLFRSLTATMDFVTKQAVALLDSNNNTQHSYSLRLRLSTYELPGPMRLYAFISSDWHLDTGWIAWQSEKS